MTTGPDDTNRLDPAVVGVAILVAVHCAAARWLPAALGGETAHAVAAGVAAAFSAVVCIRGWLDHREFRVFSWAAGGWFGLLLARTGGGSGLGEVAEVVVTLAACALLVITHLLNRSLSYWHSRS